MVECASEGTTFNSFLGFSAAAMRYIFGMERNMQYYRYRFSDAEARKSYHTELQAGLALCAKRMHAASKTSDSCVVQMCGWK